MSSQRKECVPCQNAIVKSGGVGGSLSSFALWKALVTCQSIFSGVLSAEVRGNRGGGTS